MKLPVHSNSLFAVLLRSPWWVAGLVVVGTFGATRLFLPTEFALFAALPFAAIAAYVAWQQLRAPSGRRVAATLERLRTMSWDEFSVAIEKGFRRDGYSVKRLAARKDAGADFELVRGSRSTLLACKRWKATRTGVEPLRELEEARRASEAAGCIYVATGEVTAQARAFAAERSIRVLEGADLARSVELAASNRNPATRA
jgi:restriction system protein